MIGRAWVMCAGAMLAVLAMTSVADAQPRRRRVVDGAEALQQAEQAYAEVDFEHTLEHAGAALEAGGQTPDRLVRIYQLLGVSAAALGDNEGAREFFQRMLAVNPDATLDDTVPPRLRSPYLEARGVVSARPERLGVEVGLARSQSAVRVALTDPFHLARNVRVHARLEGALEFNHIEASAQRETMALVPGADSADRVEYWVEVLDEYGNQVATVGTEFAPRTVGRVAMVATGSGGTAPPPQSGGSVFEDPLFWIITGGVILVTGGVVTGVLVDQASHVPVQTGVSFGVR